ncbi:MAG: glycosyltransferase family 2 protein [Candidatus Methanoperedens sp.]|nr:glycosyltransferase family 2 protein [Candidatus Methanoperedens sp.]
MKISIIIPVYNEEITVSALLDMLLSIDFEGLETEIIVVDDGSSDDTPHILDSFSKRVTLIHHPRNMGKGSAVRTGLKNVTGDIIAIQDADLEYDPANLPKLIRLIREEGNDVVYGSRFLGNIEGMSFSHYFGNKLLTFITRLLYNSSITDMETCSKVFKREVLQGVELKSNNFEIEPEITINILKRGYRIHEIPISYTGRSKEHKKISWKDGITSMIYLIKCRFW